MGYTENTRTTTLAVLTALVFSIMAFVATPLASAAVPEKITELRAGADKDDKTKLVLFWQLPGDGGSDITGFEASYRLATGGVSPNFSSYTDCGTQAETTTTCKISGLTAGKEYFVKVRAVNADGNAPDSIIVTAITGGFSTSQFVTDTEKGSLDGFRQLWGMIISFLGAIGSLIETLAVPLLIMGVILFGGRKIWKMVKGGR